MGKEKQKNDEVVSEYLSENERECVRHWRYWLAGSWLWLVFFFWLWLLLVTLVAGGACFSGFPAGVARSIN